MEVYRARDPRMGREVAIKVHLPHCMLNYRVSPFVWVPERIAGPTRWREDRKWER